MVGLSRTDGSTSRATLVEEILQWSTTGEAWNLIDAFVISIMIFPENAGDANVSLATAVLVFKVGVNLAVSTCIADLIDAVLNVGHVELHVVATSVVLEIQALYISLQ